MEIPIITLKLTNEEVDSCNEMNQQFVNYMLNIHLNADIDYKHDIFECLKLFVDELP